MPADLTQLVADLSNQDKRSQAAERLSQLGSEAAPAAVALVRASGDDSEEVREYAVAALEEMGPPRIEDIDHLTSLLGEQKSDLGYWAATLLGRLGNDAVSAVPALASAVVGNHEEAVRQRAAWALGQIGPPAAPALDALKQAAASGDPRLTRLAQRAIEQIAG
ncbi:MAG: HEAT repeat domain-containing protein [Thermoguttaceae bacterium]|nr:HEAT repeat domain-containing protein [Thermoguttaceae bacterium]